VTITNSVAADNGRAAAVHGELDPDVRANLLREVGALYDSSARAPEPLMLPYQASCWRAKVDHAGLVLDEDTDALEIHL
jgi:hypothetical protein